MNDRDRNWLYRPWRTASEKSDNGKRTAEKGGCGDPTCIACYNPDGSLTEMAARYAAAGIELSGPSPMPTPSPSIYAEMAATMQTSPQAKPSAPNSVTDKLAEARKAVEKYLYPTSKQTVQWDDVIGNQLAKDELRDAIEASTKDAELYQFYNMTAPKGVMLFGPPGCGKTMFGKAAATAVSEMFGKETEMILINGAEIESPILSVVAKKVAALFEYARLYKQVHGVPVILFVDEADAFLRDRTRFPSSTEPVAQFLAEMDGMKDCGAFVILATNQPDMLDEALLRDGRCERKIKIERPNRKACEAILAATLRGNPGWSMVGEYVAEAVIDRMMSNDYLIQELTNSVSGANHRFLLAHIINGAMITGLLGRAKSIAFRRDKTAGTRSGVTEADLFAAVDLVYNENVGLKHSFALNEFIKDVALPSEVAKQYN